MKYLINEIKRNPYLQDLLDKLAEISNKGFIPGIGQGDSSVGMTLLSELGIEYSSQVKPNFHGIVVTTRRRINIGSNRVNLFAKVPDWELSGCKSSRDIVERYGYDSNPGIKNLYCTVSSVSKNPQGLKLKVDVVNGLLHEVFECQEEEINIGTWKIGVLQTRLSAAHPESIWVKANSIKKDQIEFFHYYEAIYTGSPSVNDLASLLETGTITMDHEITLEGGHAREKGPLFKISPSNLILLFPETKKFDLTNINEG